VQVVAQPALPGRKSLEFFATVILSQSHLVKNYWDQFNSCYTALQS
jgi:hypothetical protein